MHPRQILLFVGNDDDVLFVVSVNVRNYKLRKNAMQ